VGIWETLSARLTTGAVRSLTHNISPWNRVILYDSSGKSGGICSKVFDHMAALAAQAVDTIVNCTCVDGCPSCE
jgi:ATP-dependent helicase YprA (DUF1998 family)